MFSLLKRPLFSLALIWLALGSQAMADLLDDAEEDTKPTEKAGPSSSLEGVDGDKPKQVAPKQPSAKTGLENRAPTRAKSGTGRVGVVKFWSKSLSGFRDKGSVILEEDVVVTQDDIRLEADKATIYFDQGGKDVREVHAVGSVKFSRVDPDTGDPIKAEGKEAFFSNAKRSVVLKGEPVLHRGSDIVRGKAIYYDLKNGWVKADRVEGVVQPSNKKAGSK
jgi:lipopolysaccharide transport protein LptA